MDSVSAINRGKRGYAEVGGAYHCGRQIKHRLTTAHYQRITNNMGPIYDKTLEILFRGANPKNNNPITPTRNDFPIVGSKKPSFKQMLFKVDGSLEIGCLESNNLPTVSLCSSCDTQPSEPHLRCGYCENSHCSSCALICKSCSTPTCKNCSIDGYDNGICCLSCYR